MTLTLTENAAQKILSLINEESSAAAQMFRITVSGGGCAGFQYGFSLDDATHDDDIVFVDKGVTVAVDEASLALIEGSQIDYVEELIGSSFQIKNPNASSSCGCGSSFSI
ncbi:MAG TPA: iron-sulfur cluster insertion protein ErpA [Alphaproteobacteria bacterium]|nr:iron-sulfur cluster insertion protein ErpA [Alphaproteobacteria bacterium]